jgi:hypothetical protein
MPSWLSSFTVTSICTTLGLTRSATLTNASDVLRASACDAWSCAGDGVVAVVAAGGVCARAEDESVRTSPKTGIIEERAMADASKRIRP